MKTKHSEIRIFRFRFADDKTWEEYLGSEEDPKSSIMIRFPDGQREAKKIPCSSKFMVRLIV